MVMLIVRIKTKLSDARILEVAHARAPQFRALPGLVQKYYVRDRDAGRVAGVYLWDSMESLEAYRASDLAKTIAAAYEAVEPPVVEVGEVLFPLRG